MFVRAFTVLGLEPGFIIGSKMKDLKRNASAGKSDWFIIEGDEYDNMFLGLDPYAAVLTKVEYDHPDWFPTEEKYLDAFEKFVGKKVKTVRSAPFLALDRTGKAILVRSTAKMQGKDTGSPNSVRSWLEVARKTDQNVRNHRKSGE